MSSALSFPSRNPNASPEERLMTLTLSHLNRGEEHKADALLQLAARTQIDVVKTMRWIAECFDTGSRKVLQNFQKAAKWYLRAAEKEDVLAMHNLGVMYSAGQGVPQSYAEAFKWHLKAAEKKDVESMGDIAEMYDAGEGVAQDPAEASRWYLQAAEHGSVTAMYNLGGRYLDGNGVTKSRKMAMHWLRKGADLGDEKAMCRIGTIYCDLGKYKNAMYWYLKAAEKNQPNALFNIGTMYTSGLGVPKDLPKALEWLRKAEQAGYSDAKTLIDRITIEQTASK